MCHPCTRSDVLSAQDQGLLVGFKRDAIKVDSVCNFTYLISSPPPPVSTALVDPQNIDRLGPADRPEASPVLQWKGPVFKWQVQRHWSWSPNCFMTRTLPWRQKLKDPGLSSKFPLYVAQPMPCQLMSLHVKEGVEKSNFLQTSYKYRP